jgi:hypothetical protein
MTFVIWKPSSSVVESGCGRRAMKRIAWTCIGILIACVGFAVYIDITLPTLSFSDIGAVSRDIENHPFAAVKQEFNSAIHPVHEAKPAQPLATDQGESSSESADSSIPEPKLPVVEHDACPRAVVSGLKIEKDVRIYSSWRDKRSLVGTLKAGSKVTVLSGANIVREPDRVVVTQPFAQPSLKPGDVILRYGLDAGDYWNFWAKNAWFTVYIDQVVEKNSGCEFPDRRACWVKVFKNGIKEWWLQVKTRDGRTGWGLASKYADIKDLGNTAFDGVCADPEADGD